MTPDQILAMPAGPKMDKLLAEAVMQWYRDSNGSWRTSNGSHPPGKPCWIEGYRQDLHGFNWHPSWSPSQNMTDAWQVAIWLREYFGSFSLLAGLGWHCWGGVLQPEQYGSGDTPELAICRAALLVHFSREK